MWVLAGWMALTAPALAGELVDNAVIADFDGDGADDLAIGALGTCGAIEVWLSSQDPRFGVPEDVSDERVSLDPGTLWIEPERCDPEFGRRVLVATARDGTPILATLPDAQGVATTRIELSPELDPEIVVVGSDAGTCTTCSACEPCCGPAPCCTTHSGSGHETHYFTITLEEATISSIPQRH